MPAAPPANPFADRIVPDPETPPAVSVQSYNGELLDRLANRLLEGAANKRNYTQASVLISSNPGTGKTHLLSRLIDAIGARSLPVFIPPIRDSDGLGAAVLNRVVARLWRTVEGGHRVNRIEWLTLQLLGASCAAQDEETAAQWRDFPLEELDKPYFQEYLAATRAELEWYLSRRLADLVAKPLTHEPAAWARALIDVISHDPKVEAVAVQWIRGQVKNYPGLVIEPGEEPPAAEPAEEISRAEARLYDLAQLFGACRPLVFIFDQVENFRSFGPEALRQFFHLVERLLTTCSATQIVVSLNAADWGDFINFAGLEQSYYERFHPPRRMRGLLEAEARELRDLRAGPEQMGLAARLIPDAWIRQRLDIGPDGLPRREITPRLFMAECAERWEAGEEALAIPRAPVVVAAPEVDFEGELRKARAVAAREPFGFFGDTIRTLLHEVLGAGRKAQRSYEFALLDDAAIFAEEGAHWGRWEAWARAAETLQFATIRAIRPAPSLSAQMHQRHAPIPSEGWMATPSLHRLLEEKLVLLEVDENTMLDIIAACRLLDAAADLGRTRMEIATWLDEQHGARWRTFFSAPAASSPAGADRNATRSPVRRAEAGEGVVVLSVTRLMHLLTHGGALEPEPVLPRRERSVIFHDLASRFVQQLIAESGVEGGLHEALERFLAHSPLWQHACTFDVEPPRIRDALGELVARIEQLRAGAGTLRSWQELYISTELQVNQALGVYEGVTLLLSGRCDVLRRRVPGGPPEIVDYKLSTREDHAVEQQVQLALYARLLAQGTNPMRCGGTLELYAPALMEARYTHKQLRLFFEKEIEPELRQLAREAVARQPSARRIYIDTLAPADGPETPMASRPSAREPAAPPQPAAPVPIPGGEKIDEAFADFIGNVEVVNRLKTALAGACLDGPPPTLATNLLLTGPGGLGKTELARRIARALRFPFIEVPGSRLGGVDDLFTLADAALANAGLAPRESGLDSGLPRFVYPRMVIFIDEAHELRRRADHFLNLFEPRERRAVGSDKIGDFRAATLIAATTDAGLLPKAFLTRFHPYAMQPYSAAEVAEMLRRGGVPGGQSFLEGLATLSRLNPRLAQLRAEEMVTHHRVHGLPLDEQGLAQFCTIVQVDRDGLSARDWQYLELLRDAPLGVDLLASSLQVEKAELMRDIEPYLHQLGLMTLAHRGRELTAKGRARLERRSPSLVSQA